MIRPSTLYRRISPTALAALLVGVPVAAVAAAGWTALIEHRQVRDAVSALSASTRMQSSARAVLGAVTDAETGVRGYLVTQDAAFLEAYQQSAPRVPALLDALTSASGPSVHPHAAEVRRLVDSRMRLIDARLAEARQGRFVEARAAVASGDGKRLMDRLRSVVGAIDAEQARLQSERADALREALRTQAMALWTMLAVLGMALVGGIRELLRRLRHHEQIVTMCAWSHTIRDGDRWVSIEDYLHRHYDVTISHGISPEQFDIAARAIDTARKQRQPTA